jgi:hypothetical protein
MNVTPQEMKWERDGRTVYTLMHHGWSKGEEQFRNRYYFQVQYDHSTLTEKDGEAMAETIISAIETRTWFVWAMKEMRARILNGEDVPLVFVEAALIAAGEPV